MRSDGIYLTELLFEDSKNSFKHIDKYKQKSLPIFDETKKWLDVYFEGKEPNFIPKYRIDNLTPFRKQVIDIINKIPSGKLVSYNDIAKEIEKGKEIKKVSRQAVGGAVGWNPICIIIPCHRVIGIDGNLTGYSGGIKNKIKLLELEKHDINKFIISKDR